MSSAIATALPARLHRAQLLDLGLELGDRLFEIEIAAHLRKSIASERDGSKLAFAGLSSQATRRNIVPNQCSQRACRPVPGVSLTVRRSIAPIRLFLRLGRIERGLGLLHRAAVRAVEHEAAEDRGDRAQHRGPEIHDARTFPRSATTRRRPARTLENRPIFRQRSTASASSSIPTSSRAICSCAETLARPMSVSSFICPPADAGRAPGS